MENLSKTLLQLAKGNDEYAVFNKKIVNTKKTILGVRMPDLRKLAKKTATNMKFSDVSDFLKKADKNVYEEVLMSGFLINYSKLSDKEQIKLICKYLKYADSWALIDCFTKRYKKFDGNLHWDFAVECLASKKEFEVRYGIIFMMSNFLNKEHVGSVFKELRKIKHPGYYVKIAVAWLFATAAVKFYKETLAELKNQVSDKWTYNKSLQKMLESYRFTDRQKAEIKKMKKTNRGG
ncbi:MAG: DNA alkylation repair protein [Endomicrobium sp.]|nr:DNA alkylation repair protein [Endomicrobium sp.]